MAVHNHSIAVYHTNSVATSSGTNLDKQRVHDDLTGSEGLQFVYDGSNITFRIDGTKQNFTSLTFSYDYEVGLEGGSYYTTFILRDDDSIILFSNTVYHDVAIGSFSNTISDSGLLDNILAGIRRDPHKFYLEVESNIAEAVYTRKIKNFTVSSDGASEDNSTIQTNPRKTYFYASGIQNLDVSTISNLPTHFNSDTDYVRIENSQHGGVKLLFGISGITDPIDRLKVNLKTHVHNDAIVSLFGETQSGSGLFANNGKKNISGLYDYTFDCYRYTSSDVADYQNIELNLRGVNDRLDIYRAELEVHHANDNPDGEVNMVMEARGTTSGLNLTMAAPVASISGNFNLFLKNQYISQDANMFLFNGYAYDNFPLFLEVIEGSTTGSFNQFISGKDTETDDLNFVMHSLVPTTDDVKLVMRSGAQAGHTNLVINGDEDITEDCTLFTKSNPFDNFNLILVNTTTPGEMNLFISGDPIDTNFNLVTFGKTTESTEMNLVITGTSWSDTNDDFSLFTRSSTESSLYKAANLFAYSNLNPDTKMNLVTKGSGGDADTQMNLVMAGLTPNLASHVNLMIGDANAETLDRDVYMSIAGGYETQTTEMNMVIGRDYEVDTQRMNMIVGAKAESDDTNLVMFSYNTNSGAFLPPGVVTMLRNKMVFIDGTFDDINSVCMFYVHGF